MKFKKEYLVLPLIIIALSLYLSMRSKDQTHFELPTLASVESKAINRLLISKADETIELNKKDDQWRIAPKDYLANSIILNNMAKAAADLAVTALVSEAEKYERYDLNDARKINVQALSDKKVLRNVNIGRVAPTNRHTFIQLDGDGKVYHARGDIHRTFNQTISELRDKTVLSLEKDVITSLSLTKGERNRVLTKKEMPAQDQQAGEDQAVAAEPKFEWVDDNGQAASQKDVKKVLDGFASIKCDAYMDDDAKAGLRDARWTVTFKTGDQAHSLSVFAGTGEDAEQVPAVSSGNDYAFLLDKSRVETFETQVDALLKIEPAEDKQ